MQKPKHTENLTNLFIETNTMYRYASGSECYIIVLREESRTRTNVSKESPVSDSESAVMAFAGSLQSNGQRDSEFF